MTIAQAIQRPGESLEEALGRSASILKKGAATDAAQLGIVREAVSSAFKTHEALMKSTSSAEFLLNRVANGDKSEEVLNRLGLSKDTPDLKEEAKRRLKELRDDRVRSAIENISPFLSGKILEKYNESQRTQDDSEYIIKKTKK